MMDHGYHARATGELVKERHRDLHEPRSVFTKGHRLYMNIVPMFINVFAPWGLFVLCCGLCAFSFMYRHPGAVGVILCIAFIIVILVAITAVQARIRNPEPTWLSVAAVLLLIALIFGTITGLTLYFKFTHHNMQLFDLKVTNNVDASRQRGHDIMDAGIAYFTPGTTIDNRQSWHFKRAPGGTMYCVAPIMTNNLVPNSQSYDFWAVGKDCCAVGASDFRCNAWRVGGAHAAIRVLDDEDMSYYRLAVQQAEGVFGIHAREPLLFEWHADPLASIAIGDKRLYRDYLLLCAFMFILFLMLVCLASARFAWLGRAVHPPKGPYKLPEYGAAGYGHYGSPAPQYGAHMSPYGPQVML